MTDAELRARLHHDRYRRSNDYEPQWLIDNLMGPHPLWLLEALLEVVPIERGSRVLDLGCGRAVTSIFLARELDVQVWATDLWIAAADNFARIQAAGVDDRVFPIHAEAHDLPYADGFFDAVIAIDSFQHFGTDETYLGYLTRFLRPGGRIGTVEPALFRELGTEVPAHLADIWQWHGLPFHGPDWWRTHWEKTGLVDVEAADAVPDGWQDWLRWAELTGPMTDAQWKRDAADNEAELLRRDRGDLIGFTRIVATTARNDLGAADASATGAAH